MDPSIRQLLASLTLLIQPLSVSPPQSPAKMEASVSHGKHEPILNSAVGGVSLRQTTRSKLWEHPEEEDLFLLATPLEVDSETPVADALIKRLQDEEEKQKGTMSDAILKTRYMLTRAPVLLPRRSCQKEVEDQKDDIVRGCPGGGFCKG